MSSTASTPRFRSIGCAVLFAALLAPAVPGAASGPSDTGLSPARAWTPAERARLESKAPATRQARWYEEMSPMGAVAAGVARPRDPDDLATVERLQGVRLGTSLVGGGDIIVHGSGDAGLQSETTIAANGDGSVLIAGYNDLRGFSTTPVSVSGVARSIDGGLTWSEVPVGPGGAGTLPSVAGGRVSGDPDVKFDPTRNRFVYSSIYVRPSDGLQGMCVHYSDATGSTWTGPIEVPGTFVASQAADKEFIDVNTLTGRIVLTWTMFSTTTRIQTCYSDDGGLTWSAAVTIATAPVGGGLQASVPRVLPGATDATSQVYAVWRVSSAGGRNIAMSRSTDGGVTWSVPVNITSNFTPEDYILGVDRVNCSPSMAIDYSTGRVYVVYQANNSLGEGDIAFQTLVGAPALVPRILIDSNPGADRAQFYPAVAADQTTHRVHVIWYDQDPETSGDVTELMHTDSDDGGATWSRPTPLFDRPFHIGYGNDTSQPNVGDYMQAVALDGVLHSLSASTNQISQFDEGQVGSTALFSPDSYYDQLPDATVIASLRLGAVTIAEACPAGVNGCLDPGETADLTFALENYVGNANDSPVTYTGVSATLSSSTPGVSILTPTRSYGNIAALATVSNGAPFQLRLDGGMVPGTYVRLLLTVSTDQGSIQLPYLLTTGTPSFSTIFSEDFESAVMPALPAGWSSVVGGGTATPPWVTANTIPGGGLGTQMAFHANGTAFRWHRLWSPNIVVPPAPPGVETYVTLDFDLATSTEVELANAILAYDGLTLRITDQTSGQTLRSVLAEAFAEVLTTGAVKHFPRHTPRNSSTGYFEDMSVWAGSSGGMTHVAMKFPGAGMAGRTIQLRWEYAEDGSADCTASGLSTPCGVAVDNVVVKLATPGTSFAPTATSASLTSDANPVIHLQPLTLTATVAPASATGSVEFFDGAVSLGTAPVAAGSAQIVNSTLSVGVHSLSAVFSGSACDLGSTSSPYSQTVNTEVGVGDGPAVTEFAITGIVPNPVTGRSTIGFTLPRDTRVSLGVYDVSGRLVRQLASGRWPAGRHALAWDGQAGGASADAGLYFVRLEADGVTRIARFAVLR